MQLSGFQNAIIKPLSHEVDQRSSYLIAQLKRPCMEFANNFQHEGLNICFFLLVYKTVMISYPKEVITGIWWKTDINLNTEISEKINTSVKTTTRRRQINNLSFSNDIGSHWYKPTRFLFSGNSLTQINNCESCCFLFTS